MYRKHARGDERYTFFLVHRRRCRRPSSFSPDHPLSFCRFCEIARPAAVDHSGDLSLGDLSAIVVGVGRRQWRPYGTGMRVRTDETRSARFSRTRVSSIRFRSFTQNIIRHDKAVSFYCYRRAGHFRVLIEPNKKKILENTTCQQNTHGLARSVQGSRIRLIHEAPNTFKKTRSRNWSEKSS